jgi:prepilin-type N-terminal cleavage/methylation domain-containing protein
MRTEMKRGFTMIELMVVIVLVMILSLAVVPAFKQAAVKAKYTEGASAISALRTLIKVYHTEYSRLPGVPDSIVYTTNNIVGGASWAVTNSLPTDVTSLRGIDSPAHRSIVQTLCSKTNEQWAIVAVAGTTGSLTKNTDPNFVGASSLWQRDLSIDVGEYSGASFKDGDYQYAAFHAGIKSPDYGYAILVAGSGERKSPPVGTGYGVMEILNSKWSQDRLLTLTFTRYKAREGADNNPLFLNPGALTDGEKGNKVVIPMWGDVLANKDDGGYSTETSAGIPIITNFKLIGWEAQ